MARPIARGGVGRSDPRRWNAARPRRNSHPNRSVNSRTTPPCRRALPHRAEIAARLRPDAVWLAQAIAEHHERLDGTGYPAGLRGGQMSSLSRLLAVCDVYAASCTARPYRKAKETRTALTDVLLMAGNGVLDRDHAERLLELSFYPVGSAVETTDGSLGLVTATPAATARGEWAGSSGGRRCSPTRTAKVYRRPATST